MPRSISSKTSVERPGGAGEADPERKHETRALAAGGDSLQRREVGAGRGRQHETATVDALPRGGILHPLERDTEPRMAELERAELRGDRRLQPSRRRLARPAERMRETAERLLRRARRPLQGGQMPLPFVEPVELAAQPRQQAAEFIGFHPVLAGGGTQREEALLDRLQPAGLRLDGARGLGKCRVRLIGLDRRAVEGLAERVQSAAGKGCRPFDGTVRRPETRRDTAARREFARGLVERLGKLLAVQQPGALRGAALFLPRFGRKRLQLGHRMAEIRLLAVRRLSALSRFAQGGLGGAPSGMGFGQSGTFALVARERVQQAEMGRPVQQAAGRVAALDLHQAVADALEQPDADRRIVDEGAAPPVRRDGPPEDERAVRLQPVLGRQRMGG